MPRKKKTVPKMVIEVAVVGALILGIFAVQSVPSGVPVASPAPASDVIFEGTGPVPPFNLKHFGPMDSRTYNLSVTSDNPVSIILLNSFEDVENFAKGENAVYYTNCNREDFTTAAFDCAVFDGAFIAIYNHGEYTASVSLLIRDAGASYVTGFAVRNEMSSIKLPYTLHAEAVST